MKRSHAASPLRAAVVILAAVFVTDTVLILLFSSFTLGTVLMMLMSAALTALSVFYEKVMAATQSGVPKILRNVFLFGLCAYLVFVSFILLSGRSDADYTEDIIIVLGGGLQKDGTPARQLRNRLDGCIEYCERNGDAYIIVSGGLNSRAHVIEARSMADYLIRHGIDPDRILLEERSTSTRENLEYSKRLLDRNGIDYSDGIVIVTSNYHIYRSKAYAHQKGFETVRALGVNTGLLTLIPSVMRESCAVAAMLVFNY